MGAKTGQGNGGKEIIGGKKQSKSRLRVTLGTERKPKKLRDRSGCSRGHPDSRNRVLHSPSQPGRQALAMLYSQQVLRSEESRCERGRRSSPKARQNIARSRGPDNGRRFWGDRTQGSVRHGIPWNKV